MSFAFIYQSLCQHLSYCFYCVLFILWRVFIGHRTDTGQYADSKIKADAGQLFTGLNERHKVNGDVLVKRRSVL